MKKKREEVERERDAIVEVVELILERLGPAELSEIAETIDERLNEIAGRHVAEGLPTETSASLRVLRALRRACPPRNQKGGPR